MKKILAFVFIGIATASCGLWHKRKNSETEKSLPGIKASKIMAGWASTCAITEEGSLFCWGGAWKGVPKLVDLQAGGHKVVDVEMTGEGSTTPGLIVLDDGSVRSWDYDKKAYSKVVNFGGNRQVIAVASPLIGPGQKMCAILSTGTVQCWNKQTAPELVDLGEGRTAKALSSGDFHTCALLDDGTVKCWGANTFGQLGNGTYDDSSVPVSVGPLGGKAIALSTGSKNSCVLIEDGTIQCWGNASNFGLKVGDGFDNRPQMPPPFSEGRKATAIATGDDHICAILDDGAVSCWGLNNYWQRGDTDGLLQTSPGFPFAFDAGNKALSITAGRTYTCVIVTDKTVRCWGENYAGQIGNGTYSERSLPVATK